MKTYELPAGETTQFLEKRVLQHDEVLHGSPRLHLDHLRPQTSDYVHFDPESEPARISATELGELAIFYALVQKVVKLAGLYRGSGIKETDDGYLYLMSKAAKSLVRRRYEAGLRSAVYYVPRRLFVPYRSQYEWSCYSRIQDPPSIAVSLDCLSFDIDELVAPNDIPEVYKNLEERDIPPETPLKEEVEIALHDYEAAYLAQENK